MNSAGASLGTGSSRLVVPDAFLSFGFLCAWTIALCNAAVPIRRSTTKTGSAAVAGPISPIALGIFLAADRISVAALYMATISLHNFAFAGLPLNFALHPSAIALCALVIASHILAALERPASAADRLAAAEMPSAVAAFRGFAAAFDPAGAETGRSTADACSAARKLKAAPLPGSGSKSEEKPIGRAFSP